MWLSVIFLFLLGIIIGSFLNVVGLRFNSGLSLMGRSFCVVCRKKLPAWELVPVFSFLLLRGKCSGCKTKISKQYITIELWTGILFVTLFVALFQSSISSFFILSYALLLAIFSIYTVILIYDARHKIIPDALVYASIFLAIPYRIVTGGSLADWLAGPILFVFFGSIWLLSKGRAMGFGDAKLGLSIGILLGMAQGLSAMVLAFWIGTAVTLLYMLALRSISSLSRGRKRLTMKSEIPFAPFMIIGAWAALVFHLDLFNVLLFI